MTATDDAPDYLTAHEVAELLRIRERKVYELARQGEIPCLRVTGKLLFPRERLHAWLAGAPARANALANVVAGSHDPLLDWAIRESQSGLATLFDGSLDGLDRVVRGEAVAAGIHVFEPDTGGWNVAHVEARAGDAPFVLMEWARRRHGLLVAPASAGTISRLQDLRGATVVRRQPTAGGAILLSHLIACEGLAEDDFSYLGEIARTETEAAAAVAAGRADAAPGLETMARQFGLAFVPTMEERFDLLVDRRAWFEPPLQALAGFARTARFADKARELAGYDLSGHGRVHWNGP